MFVGRAIKISRGFILFIQQTRGALRHVGDFFARLHHLVHQPVCLGLFRRHEVVAVAILLDLINGPPGVLGDNIVEPLLELEHVFDADFHVARRPFRAAKNLMNHDVGVRQRVTLALCSAAEQHRAHARRLANAIGVYVARQELHCVVNRQSRRDAAAGRIDVEMNVLLRIAHLEEKQLGNDEVRHHVVHRRAQKHDAIHEQPRINIVAALAAPRLLHNHRYRKFCISVPMCTRFEWQRKGRIRVGESAES